MKRFKRIAIVLRMSGAAGRDILSGIFHFTRSHPHWHTRLFQMPGEFTPEAFLTEKAAGLDGIIVTKGKRNTTTIRVTNTKQMSVAVFDKAKMHMDET